MFQRHEVDDTLSVSVAFRASHICFASTLTTFDFAMKEKNTDEEVENLTLAERPFLGRINKDEDLQGEALVVPVIHTNPQGVAGSGQSTAATNETNVVGKKFTATVGDYFGSVTVGGKVLKLSRGNPGAFLQNKLAETDGLYEQMADSLATYLWGNGGGALGQIAAGGISSETATLTNKSDAMNFEVGQVIVSSENDGSDAAHTLQTGSTYVTSVDRTAGTVTFEDISDMDSIDAGDYLFRQGDFFGNTGVVVLKGVQAYIASSDTPADLYGMVRTSDPTRLAGCRVASDDLTAKNIEERLRILGSKMSGTYKAKGPWEGFLHPEDWQILETSLQSRGIRPLKDDSTRFGYMKIQMVVGGQTVDFFVDRFAPRGTAFLLRMKNWTLHSAGKMIAPVNGDGLSMLRKSTTNDYEFRLESYLINMCNAPGYNGRVALPTAA
jgi:hypothetical protein